MLVLVQPTSDPPQDWVEIDHTDWPRLEVTPHALNVQGVIFEGYDHYAVEPGPERGCVVTVWSDDDSSPTQRWTFLPPAPDPAFGGRVNTRQQVEQFDGERPAQDIVRFRAASAFRPPIPRRDGRWVPDALHAEHQQVRSVRTWDEWIGA